MNTLLHKIFSLFSNAPAKEAPNNTLRFGRYSDNNKTVQQAIDWSKATDLYNTQEYQKSIDLFFSYLKDAQENNIDITNTDGIKKFIIYQGTKKIYGEITATSITAKVDVAIMKKPVMPVMRKLLDQNNILTYTKYGLHDNIISMHFYSTLQGASPNKLYYALREIATKSDKLDDLLINEFEDIKPIDDEHVLPFSNEESQIKYTYFKQWIDETLNECESLNQDTYSGAIAYLLLTLIFKIDYLICPEGKLLFELEKINAAYWEDKEENVETVFRNEAIKKGLRELLKWSKPDIIKYFYRAKSTFAITTPRALPDITETLKASYDNMLWYKEKKQTHIANQIIEYGFLYNQFAYSMPSAYSKFVLLYMRVNYVHFFIDLKYGPALFNVSKNTLDVVEIKKAIQHVLHTEIHKYKNLTFKLDALNFNTLCDFNTTYMNECMKLNFETNTNV